MGGMYTATPGTTTAFVGPPGWNASWPWPGPWPPGYIPVLSLLGSVPASAAPGATVSDISFKLADQVSWGTDQPTGDTMHLTAALNSGGSLQLKGTGESDQFAFSMSFSFSDQGDNFWGMLEDIIFNTTESDIGDYILLSCTCEDPLRTGQTLGKIEAIPIVNEGDYHARYNVAVTYEDPPGAPSPPWLYYRYYGNLLIIQKNGDPSPQATLSGYFDQKFSTLYSNVGTGPPAVFTAECEEEPFGAEDGYYIGQLDGGQKEWQINLHTPDQEDVFEVQFEALSFTQHGGEWDLTFEAYQGSELIETKTKNMVKAVGEAIPLFTWLEFDSSDGTVTVITE